MFNTPIIMLVFNRPDLTEKVLSKVAAIAPRELFVVADGPRKDHPEDWQLTKETRELFSNLGWDCKLHVNFRDENLGCRKSVSNGLSWAFELVDRTIIPEDYCVQILGFSPLTQKNISLLNQTL